MVKITGRTLFGVFCSLACTSFGQVITTEVGADWPALTNPQAATSTGLGQLFNAAADKSGNLIFRRTARNFNPAVAKAGKVTVVEVEEIVETGTFDPDAVHLPGIYVHRIVLNANPEKRIEKRTITEKSPEKAGV